MNTPHGGLGRGVTSRAAVLTTAFLLSLALALTACAPTDDGASGPSATLSTPQSATPTPTGSSTSPAGSTPSPSASAPDSDAGSSGPGCPANGITIPEGAETSAVADVDGDGKPDTQFYTENPDFAYGISTASGATILLADDLAGPGKHSGWSERLESGLVVTVLDDGRAATLHAFVDCAFVTTTATDGSRFDLYLQGFGDASTGVECSEGNGGRWLGSVLATRLDSGRYTISRTQLDFSADGTTVTNGYTSELATDIAADDPRVALAMESRCGDTPKVATSGM